ncbi:MAG: hypothetical protein ACRDZO_09970 [Egibacteraceae bacterium]
MVPRRLAALTAVIFAGYSTTAVALPLVSRDRYGSAIVLASAVTGYTAGALAGALLIARWRPRNQGWAALAGLACYGFAPLSLMFPVHAGVVVAAYVVVGLGIEVFNVPWFTATQREVPSPPAGQGHVFGLPGLLRSGARGSGPDRSSHRGLRAGAGARVLRASVLPRARRRGADPQRSPLLSRSPRGGEPSGHWRALSCSARLSRPSTAR